MWNNTENKFSSKKWCKLLEVEVLGPDGWDRGVEDFNKKWVSEKITFDEFRCRLFNSTINDLKSFYISDIEIARVRQYLCMYGENIKLNENGYLTGYIPDTYHEFYFKIIRSDNLVKTNNIIFYIKPSKDKSVEISLENLSELLGCIKGLNFTEEYINIKEET